jgi:pimeloyl-ACP methyl ester carboxylesterase
MFAVLSCKEEAAVALQPMPDVIVLLPGVTGSVLHKDGKEVWGASGSALLRGVLSGAGSIQGLALQGDGPDEDLGDGVTAPRLMPDVHLIPGFWKIDGYGRIRETITGSYDVTEGQNYFEFPYDWRRDNAVTARRLQRVSHDWLTRWRQASGNEQAKLLLIAHSMGGLVSRYFLEVLEGWRDTKALITFGTPYRGSLNALDTLANGVRKGPFGLFDLSNAVRSFTSTYQLLPIYPVYDTGTGALLRVGETDGIPNVDPRRAREALTFHHAIRDGVTSHQEHAAYRERGYRIFPVVGIEQPTSQSAALSDRKSVV